MYNSYIQHNNKQPSWSWDLLLLFIVVGLFFMVMLGSHALLNPDEGRYSEIVREMVASGNYLVPHLNGAVFLEKPILFYWLDAMALKFFGMHDWVVRFFPALIGVGGCLMTYAVGRILFNRRTGLLAAIILATSPLYFALAHYTNMDLEVAVFTSCSLFAFIVGLNQIRPRPRSWWLWAGYAFAGLAFLAKGLIGVFFPAAILFVWFLSLNQWAHLRHMRIWSGLLIFLVIAAPWFVWMQVHNPNFFNFFFITQQFSRYVTDDFNCHQPFYFYLATILVGFLPWCVFLPMTFWRGIKAIWNNKLEHKNEFFLLLWVLIIFVFFSIPRSKLVGYIVPVVPPLSLLVAAYLDKMLELSRKREALIAAVVWCFLGFVAAGIALYLPHFSSLFSGDMRLICYVIAVVLVITTLLIIYFILKKKFRKILLVMVINSVICMLLCLSSVANINRDSTKVLALELLPHLHKQDVVALFYEYYQDLPYYLQRKIHVVQDWPKLMHHTTDDWKSTFIAGLQFRGTDKSMYMQANQLKKLWLSEKRVFVVSDIGEMKAFKRRVGERYYTVLRHHNVVVISNKKSLLKGP